MDPVAQSGYSAVRVVLVDDHPLIRSGVKNLLSLTDGVEVVGEANDAGGAVRLAAKLEPDLLVLDLKLKGKTSGIEACREVKMLPKAPCVLIHTAYNTAEDLAAAVLVDADGYFHKGAEYAEFPEAVRRICAGERVWVVDTEPEEAEYWIEETQESLSLTPKEREVFALVLRRHSNAEIARALFISLPTVKTHMRSILRKLNVKNRKELFQLGVSRA